ncbi:MAG: glycogen/starch/alpha-glucan family phosphorylase [Erysipelotrichaceae bacterium]|nr:glycogen/starch/alpha-glucan family phosphorylase [Erysipelotrichaceae bacterium]
MNLKKELTSLLNQPIKNATDSQLYEAVVSLVKNRNAEIPAVTGDKKLYYISAEFLIGRQLGKNLINLGLYDEMKQMLAEEGKDLSSIEQMESEPSLGNGGLGRLAACFLDSIATLDMAGDGIGLNYHFGLFRQKFENNRQVEVPDEWLTGKNFLIDTGVSFPVELAGKTYQSHMYDLDVIGYHGNKNRLHLFDLDSVDASIIKDGISFDKTDIEKNLTLFLYPDDSDDAGRKLRIYQQYFMVSNAAQLILKEEKEKGHSLRDLGRHVAIQINDTHPSMVIPELIRLLINEGITFKEAAMIVTDVCGYTNHTILAEALEKWPLDYMLEVVPQLMPIIEGLDYVVSTAYHGNPDLAIIDHDNRIHMARMDMHFSHSINGVAALHTEILKNQELKPFYDIYPSKFNNKTNGITFRRWIMHCNPALASLFDQMIGTEWRKNADQLERLLDHYNDEWFLDRLDEIKHDNKVRFAQYMKKSQNVDIDPDSIIDIQIKRMHEYKRQQMNVLYVIYKYLQIKAGNVPTRPITVVFGGKAAPAYYQAKCVIHAILCLSQLINNDPEVSRYLKVVMIENYNISKAELAIPASDVSEQISLASKEASGTGNMKFMLNGAVTLGTNDGANVEIAQLVGKENIYTFGKSSDEVINLYNTNGYHASDYYNGSELIRNCIDLLTSEEMLAIGDKTMLNDLRDNLINKDWFMTLLDLEEYCNVKDQVFREYEDRGAWKRKSLVNIAKSGFFSSDRTIEEYNRDIWHLK